MTLAGPSIKVVPVPATTIVYWLPLNESVLLLLLLWTVPGSVVRYGGAFHVNRCVVSNYEGEPIKKESCNDVLDEIEALGPGCWLHVNFGVLLGRVTRHVI
jgi:hypothetical protein